MSWNDVLDATALEQAAMIRRREIASEELVRLYLDRIARLDVGLNAFVSVFRRGAMRDARAADAAVRAGGPLPPFHGVPVGVKDLNFVRFAWTRLGSRGFVPLFSPVDDYTARSLRRGGFVLVGKLATSELGAMPVTETDLHPPTRNPWNAWHTAGGSSGGSGAAVAARLLPLAHGSDGAGSIRIPAAFCHLYGIKPSRGRVRNAMGRPDRDILYSCGPITRSVADAAAMLDVLAGLDVGRPHWAPAPLRPYRAQLDDAPTPLRIRVATRATVAPTDPFIADAVVKAAHVFAEQGHHVEEGTLPEGSLEEFLPLWQHVLSRIPMVRFARTQPITRWLAESGRTLRDDDMLALQRRMAVRLEETLGKADIWLTPTVSVAAPRVGTYANRPPAEAFAAAAVLGQFTAPSNITGRPAASVPLGLTPDGLPMGLQIVGRLHCEHEVLALSQQFERARPWRERVAPIGADGPGT